MLLLTQWGSIYDKEITSATVTDLVPTYGTKGTTYKVVATFKDRNRIVRQYTSAWSSKPPAHKVGDVIKIVYDRDNPDKNSSLSFNTRFGAAWIIIGVGLFLLWITFGKDIGAQFVDYHFPKTHD